MKLFRHGPSGDEKPGLVDASGGLRDLSGIVRDIAGPALAPDSLARLRALDPETLPKLPPDVRLGPCVGGTRNVVAIGLNFADLAAENEARSLYLEAAKYCDSINDRVSKRLFEDLAEDEEGHIDFLETQLELIKQIGLPLYAQKHIGGLEQIAPEKE
ncbi:ferritin-like domain-containing protein [Methylobacterium organophilum]|nr:ferritin-like domain-containing protein [Methylobacterium organophilum]